MVTVLNKDDPLASRCHIFLLIPCHSKYRNPFENNKVLRPTYALRHGPCPMTAFYTQPPQRSPHTVIVLKTVFSVAVMYVFSQSCDLSSSIYKWYMTYGLKVRFSGCAISTVCWWSIFQVKWLIDTLIERRKKRLHYRYWSAFFSAEQWRKPFKWNCANWKKKQKH